MLRKPRPDYLQRENREEEPRQEWRLRGLVISFGRSKRPHRAHGYLHLNRLRGQTPARTSCEISLRAQDPDLLLGQPEAVARGFFHSLYRLFQKALVCPPSVFQVSTPRYHFS